MLIFEGSYSVRQKIHLRFSRVATSVITSWSAAFTIHDGVKTQLVRKPCGETGPFLVLGLERLSLEKGDDPADFEWDSSTATEATEVF